jgi:hypothetical protein
LKLAKMQQRHELEMAKIQAQAAADSRRPQAPGGPTAFAPQVTQNTVVKVVQEGGGCGCSGCAWIILLIVLGVLGAILYLGSMTR